MKITVYSSKGGVGKTPIAANIVMDREYAVGVNEKEHVYEDFEDISDDRILPLDLSESFPEIPGDIDIVFDLGGAISATSKSIPSAILQSDLVIVPIENEYKAIKKGLETLKEIEAMKGFTGRVIIVATKLKKGKKETFGDDWKGSKAYMNIVDSLKEEGFLYPVIPLKESAVYETIFERELSICQLRADNALSNYSFKIPDEQFNAIYQAIDLVESEIDYAEQEQPSTSKEHA